MIIPYRAYILNIMVPQRSPLDCWLFGLGVLCGGLVLVFFMDVAIVVK